MKLSFAFLGLSVSCIFFLFTAVIESAIFIVLRIKTVLEMTEISLAPQGISKMIFDFDQYFLKSIHYSWSIKRSSEVNWVFTWTDNDLRASRPWPMMSLLNSVVERELSINITERTQAVGLLILAKPMLTTVTEVKIFYQQLKAPFNVEK